MARPRRFLALLTAAICSAWPTPFEDPQLPAQVPQADAPRRTRPKLLSVGGLRSSQVAIFLLNTPMVAWDPNADPNGKRRKPDGGDTGAGRWQWGYDFYQKRTLGASQTWGAYFPNLYFVWGTGPARGQPADERRWLDSPNCTEHEKRPGRLSPGGWRLHRCCDGPAQDPAAAGGGLAGGACVTVLEARECDARYYGATGPCCRCEAALNFFATALNFSREGGFGSLDQRSLGRAPEWFVFQDDDVLWRPRALLGLLAAHSAHPGPLSLAYETHWYDDARARQAQAQAASSLAASSLAVPLAVHTRGFSDQHVPKPIQAECSVDCVHRFPWMMASALNLAAVRRLAPAARLGGLRHLCRVSGLTHDGGLGLLAWLHQVPFVSLDPLFADGKPTAASLNKRWRLDLETRRITDPGELCGLAGFHRELTGRRWDPRTLFKALRERCPPGSAERAARSFSARALVHANDGFARLDWARMHDPSKDVLRFIPPEACHAFEVPAGVKLGGAGNRSCVCEADGEVTHDGRCKPGRWQGGADPPT